MENEKVFLLMEKLKISEEEAWKVLEDDQRIDRGEKLFELSEEQKKAEKQAKNAKREPTVYTFQKRERKANTEKRELMELLENAVGAVADTIEVINPEREMIFTVKGKKYKIVLSEPRK